MSQFTLLYGARQLLTLRGPSSARRGSALQDLGLIENGSVLIEDKVIFAVGTTRRIENLKQARDAVMIDVSDCIIMPGLIDPHFHVTSMVATATGQRQLKPSRILDDGVALMRSCLHHGTLSAVLKTSANADNFLADASLLRQWTKVGTSNVATVRSWHLQRPPQTIEDLESFTNGLQTLVRRKLVDAITLTLDAALEPEQANWLRPLLGTNLPVNLEWQGSTASALSRVIEQLRPTSVYCRSSLSKEEAHQFASSSTVAVFAPGTEVQASGSALRDVADGGGAVALSSGYHPANTPGFSMQMAMSLAIIHNQLNAEEAITAATVNAAYAAGLGHVTGTLEQGKRADVLVMTVPDYREIARQFGINHVGTVLRSGTIAINRPRWKGAANEPSTSRVRS